MQRKTQKYLYNIQVAINSINDYLGETRDFNQYLENKLLRRAVERELEIIGEAANRLLQLDTNFPIDNARKIVDLRNFIIHGYDKVDDIIIWGIVNNHLPILKEQVERSLNQ